MPVSANYRRIGKYEVLLAKSLLTDFKRMSKYLKEHGDEYYSRAYDISREYYLIQQYPKLYKKGFEDLSDEPVSTPLADLRRELDIVGMVKKASKKIRKVAEIGFKKCFRLLTHQVELDIDRYKDPLAEYQNYWEEIQLSDYRGNISNNIKNEVVSILKNGLDNNLSWSDVAEQIESLDRTLFSPARAKTIAVTEMGKAYEYGNYQPVMKLEELGIATEKKRLTCRDDRVREAHRQAEEEGRVPFDFIFPSVNQEIAPEGVNCRCTMVYRIKGDTGDV